MGYRKQTKVSAEFNMSSLTDIIFLLLIFFMLTSSLVSPTAINLKLPSSSKTKATSSQEPIKVSVDEKQRMSIDGSSVAEMELRTKLGNKIRKDGRNPEDITVILDIHEQAEAQALVTVVDILNDYGVKMILATKLSN
ncbi:MAG: biopolymer transporter ExbD [Aureispira sp.]|nr:biopolymer transporter ExbD [Aureispira sp.]